MLLKQRLLKQTDPVEASRRVPGQLGVGVAERDDGDLLFSGEFLQGLSQAGGGAGVHGTGATLARRTADYTLKIERVRRGPD